LHLLRQGQDDERPVYRRRDAGRALAGSQVGDMSRYYAFNGDADGLCALQQLRLDETQTATLVTGVKRDIMLLRNIVGRAGDTVTVLDISLHENVSDLLRLIDSGASVRYFDHHRSGPIPSHPLLEAHIDESAEACTA